MIKVHREPPEPLAMERCCFCREKTPFWAEDEHGQPTVACCEGCAKIARPEDVPEKSVWCRREMIATRMGFK